MGIFDRLRSAGQTADNAGSGTSAQDATRLIEAGHVLEVEGKLDEAMQHYLEAVRVAPNPARAHLNRGNVLLLKGDLQGALDAFRTALEHQPDYAGAYYNIGNALLGNGRFDEAAQNYRLALQIKPDYAEVHCALGVALKNLGQTDDAIASLQRALQTDPGLAEARYNMGLALQVLGQLKDAVTYFRSALQINPHLAEAQYSIAHVLQGLGQHEDAVDNYRRALEIKPEFAEAYNSLGLVLKELGKHEEAMASYTNALNIKPDFAEAYNNLAIVQYILHQYESAVSSCRRALEFKPDLTEAYCNLGNAQKMLGQYENALASYRYALEVDPNFAEARCNLGLLLLSQGRYAEAWPAFEARYDPRYSGRNSIPPDLPFPMWQGESLHGKSLLIWPEQGFGDMIQFARYYRLLKIRGLARLTIVSTPPLLALLEKVAGVDAMIPFSEKPSLPFHDYWTFPLSLPLHFGTTIETIPDVLPYLSAPPERLSRWHDRLPKGKLKVGLVWKGSAGHKNDANRSLPDLTALAALWNISGVAFISLQKGQGEEEAAAPSADQPILHLGSEILDFADTAAIVAQLDLVICVDTAIAHLAGALKKPCWVLLPALSTDWRWLQERSDTPWYPGVMRLFRQPAVADWTSTIDEVARELNSLVGKHEGKI